MYLLRLYLYNESVCELIDRVYHKLNITAIR